MYLYQPCLLTLTLYAWAFDRSEGKSRLLLIAAPLLLLLASEWELTFSRIYLYPGALLFPAVFLFDAKRSIVWAEVLTAALLAGLISWKASDAWPLLPGRIFLCAVLLLIPIMLLCRGKEDRLFACSLAGLLYELFFCLKEYMLFSFCIMRLGSRESLSLSTAALCLYGLVEQTILAVRRGKSIAVPTAN